MQAARIINTRRVPLRAGASERAVRRAFATPLHRTATSHTKHGDLAWGEDVTLISRGVRRARVRVGDGTVGYVPNELVVSLRWIGAPEVGGRRRFTTPLWRSAMGSAAADRIHDLLWGDEVQLVHGAPVGGRVRPARAAGGAGSTPPRSSPSGCSRSTSSTSARATAC
jgi:hypothetical protein